MTTTVRLEPVIYGPTWRRDENGKFALPLRTLGWTVIDWTETHLVQPDGPDAGEPWRFTNEQQRFLLWWYALDERGRFVYRSGMLRRMKGWGKDPLSAVICLVELLGPCRFAGWGTDGEPKAEPHYAACVQIAAVSQDQVKRNTMSLFPALLPSHAIREFELDVGKEIIYAFRGRCRLEMLTASARSSEGPRPTFILKNETQHWIASTGGDEMSAVCARNAAKSRDGSTRILAISNAHAPGEGSDAELDYEAWEKLEQSGRGETAGFLYDSIEAPPFDLNNDDQLKEAIALCRGDSDWIDLDRILAEIRDPHTKEGMARRFYLNQLHAQEDRAFDYQRWLDAADPAHVVPEGALIAAGFDGSVSGDWTALIATEIAIGYQWPVGIWKPQPMALDDGTIVMRIDIAAVEAAVDALFERFHVWRFNMDPFWWKGQMDAWAGRYNTANEKPIAEWKTTNLRKMAFALLSYSSAIAAGQVSHPNEPDLNAGILNSYKQVQQFVDDNGEQMWTLRKERPLSPLKIDPAIAGALSWEARESAIAAGMLNEAWHGIYLGETEETT